MIIRCIYCSAELELPDESVGAKVQCAYCNEKFFATAELFKRQQEALKTKTLHLKPIARKAVRPPAPRPLSEQLRNGAALALRRKSYELSATKINTEKNAVSAEWGKKMNNTGDAESGVGTVLLSILVALTWPIWIVPIVIWYIIKSWVDDDGGGLDLVERERVQWLYGTGRYANKD